MKVYSKEGVELMDVKSIRQDGDTLIAKGKVMGSMPVTIAFKPEDCWQAAKLFGIALCLKIPLLLLKGFFRARKADAAAAKCLKT